MFSRRVGARPTSRSACAASNATAAAAASRRRPFPPLPLATSPLLASLRLILPVCVCVRPKARHNQNGQVQAGAAGCGYSGRPASTLSGADIAFVSAAFAASVAAPLALLAASYRSRARQYGADDRLRQLAGATEPFAQLALKQAPAERRRRRQHALNRHDCCAAMQLARARLSDCEQLQPHPAAAGPPARPRTPPSSI